MKAVVLGRVFLALILHSDSIVQSQSGGAPTCYQSGECLQSLYIDETATSDLQECLDLCKSHDLCQYFTLYEEEEVCFSFADCFEFGVETCDNCYSGSVDCYDLPCSEPGECLGGRIVEQQLADTDQECLELCQDNGDCFWYMWDGSDSVCVSLSDCPVLSDESCATCLVGHTTCGFDYETTVTDMFTDIFTDTSTSERTTSGPGTTIDLESVYDTCNELIFPGVVGTAPTTLRPYTPDTTLPTTLDPNADNVAEVSANVNDETGQDLSNVLACMSVEGRLVAAGHAGRTDEEGDVELGLVRQGDSVDAYFFLEGYVPHIRDYTIDQGASAVGFIVVLDPIPSP